MSQFSGGTTPPYPKLRYWIQGYGVPGVEDQRAIQDFVVVETRESVNSLRAELMAMSRGNYRDDHLDKFVGAKRRSRHGTYAEWAKMMLLWMAEVKG